MLNSSNKGTRKNTHRKNQEPEEQRGSPSEQERSPENATNHRKTHTRYLTAEEEEAWHYTKANRSPSDPNVRKWNKKEGKNYLGRDDSREWSPPVVAGAGKTRQQLRRSAAVVRLNLETHGMRRKGRGLPEDVQLAGKTKVNGA